jgi:tRNA dimethylallyltransferase
MNWKRNSNVSCSRLQTEGEKMRKKPLIILTGPTSIGKTALSIGLAKALDGEIISADSMQVYRDMNIGTAKIQPDEMEGVPHYLIDVLDPKEEFNVVLFQQETKKVIQEIYAHNHIPILVGGTGFYIQSVLYDIDFTQNDTDTAYRRELEQIGQEKGAAYLYDMLAKADPESAAAIHPNNRKRVIRALEYARQTGQMMSVHNASQREKESPYQFCYFVLYRDRVKLYKTIDQRVDQMMEKGLLAEVTDLYARGYGRELVSMQGLGYKELLAYLNGECSLEEAVTMIKKGTRHYAKRQLTWFRRERNVIWVNKDEFAHEQDILDYLITIIKENNIMFSNET